MTLNIYGHPFSLYTQKAIFAFYECDIPFSLCKLDEGSDAAKKWSHIWPIEHFPVLEHGEDIVPEATAIIEYLQANFSKQAFLIPPDPREAVEVRLMDRIFDNYVTTPSQRIVFDFSRPEGTHDELGLVQWKALLDKSYLWLNHKLASRKWAAGDTFSMADCAAAPALLYAHWTYPIPTEFKHVHRFRQQLIARGAYSRVLDESRQFRQYFPMGAPLAHD